AAAEAVEAGAAYVFYKIEAIVAEVRKQCLKRDDHVFENVAPVVDDNIDRTIEMCVQHTAKKVHIRCVADGDVGPRACILGTLRVNVETDDFGAGEIALPHAQRRAFEDADLEQPDRTIP